MPTFSFCPVCGNPLEKGLHGGQQRLSCAADSCRWVHWDNPVPVVAAVVERRGKIVLVRNVGWPEGWFGLVTGFLEKKESPEQGILREVKEELGLEAELQGFVGTYPFEMRNQLILAYHLTAHEGEIEIDKKEIAQYKEIPIEKVRPWPAATGIALNDWLKSRGIEASFTKPFT